MTNRPHHPPVSAPPRRRGKILAGLAAVAVAVATAYGVLALAPSPGSTASSAATTTPTNRPNLFPVKIRQPIAQPRIDTGHKDREGRAITVACGTCHATTRPRIDTRSAVELDEFHQGLRYEHGSLTCLSCHDAGNYDQLRLADGRGLPFTEALQLCAQCHGPQYRDYTRGSHGGMTGHWDLTRGPRERNHCVDCHDPHAPSYPTVLPSFAPAPDRGLEPPHRPGTRHE